MYKFRIDYIKDGKQMIWSYWPDSKEEAFGVGHELTRDRVADFFRIVRVKK